MTSSLDTTLRQLDPADPHAAATSLRAQEDLTRILATEPATALDVRRSRRGAVRLTVAAATVAAAAGAVFVAVPSLTGTDQAFAGWTAVPATVPQAVSAEAAEKCRAAQLDAGAADDEARLKAAPVAIAERRGRWLTVVLADDHGLSATCMTNEAGGPFDSWVGSAGIPTGWVQPQPRSIRIDARGPVTMDGEEASLLAGDVGSDVVGVSYQSKDHGTVEASVNGGRFALWFPGSELEDDGADVVLTFRDGTTRAVRAFMHYDRCQPATACS